MKGLGKIQEVEMPGDEQVWGAVWCIPKNRGTQIFLAIAFLGIQRDI